MTDGTVWECPFMANSDQCPGLIELRARLERLDTMPTQLSEMLVHLAEMNTTLKAMATQESRLNALEQKHAALAARLDTEVAVTATSRGQGFNLLQAVLMLFGGTMLGMIVTKLIGGH